MAPDSLTVLLSTLTESLISAVSSASKIPSITPPKDGISLLDAKNELFLSYLQNLVFLILLKIRNRHSSTSSDEETESVDNAVVKKLVELTVYLERGALNLESKLKYQIDKVLRAAQDAENAVNINVKGKPQGVAKPATKDDSSESEGDSEVEESEEEEHRVQLKPDEIDDLQYRPNPSALIRPSFSGAEVEDDKKEDGLYKPPRIQATAMPTTERREKTDKRPNRSATMAEFISEELSEAPIMQPSIGSGIVEGGRRSKSDKERQDDMARREYEEKNYVRLPKMSKKELRKSGSKRNAGYGGEDWRELGEGMERIERLTKGRGGAEGRSVLDKSRKRAVEDGPRGSGGLEVNERVQKRAKVHDNVRRDRGKN